MPTALPTGASLVRERLLVALDGLWSKQLGLVIAPPGSGKTTLMAGWSARCGAPVAWYSAEASHASATTLLAQLHRALGAVVPLRRPWQDVAELVSDIPIDAGPMVVVIDDLHLLAGTQAEATLGRLLACLPRNMRVLAASRQVPVWGLSRMRLEDGLLELGPDDLRFRVWEAEALFREHYGCGMLPEDISLLTWKTQGWAAGLQLFHLATRDRAPAERARMLAGFSAQSRLVADYLAENVLAGLDADLVRFMVRTCPLGVLTPKLCDELLDTTESAAMLAELERRQLFVYSNDSGQTYSYHAIMRSHLDGRLVDQLGEAGARHRHYQAARILLRESFTEAALRALCRAEAWEEARGVLARFGQGERADQAGSNRGYASAIDAIPPGILDADPWLGLARARCYLASGKLGPAMEAYRECELGLPERASDTCRAELLAVSPWTDPTPSPAPGWSNALRRGIARDPLEVGYGGHEQEVVNGLCALVAGQANRASAILAQAAVSSPSPVLGLGVRLAGLLAELLGPTEPSHAAATRRCLAMAAEAERLGSTWLARQAYALLALVGTPAIAAQVSAQCGSDSDRWGEVLAQLLEGAGRLLRGEAPLDVLSLAAARCRTLGAGVLEAWALACLALAEVRACCPQSRHSALAAEATARRAGVPGAQALAHMAMAHEARNRRARRQASDHLRLARALGEECGLGILVRRHDRRSGAASRPPTVMGGTTSGVPGPEPSDRSKPGPGTELRICCFGGFGVWLGGGVVELGALRPRARALLALLALRHPRPVHYEVLTESLWPEADPRSGAHRLQTAISSLRRVLGAGEIDLVAPTFLVRRGEAYLLCATSVDVADLERAISEASGARRAGALAEEAAALGRVLALHRGELLSEFGPADWVVTERDRLRWAATDAAERLGEIELARGDAAAAVSAARAGLELDHYRESLWRLALRAAKVADDHGLEAMLSRGRVSALAELGMLGAR